MYFLAAKLCRNYLPKTGGLELDPKFEEEGYDYEEEVEVKVVAELL